MTLFLIDPPRAGLLEGGSNGLVALADWVERRSPGTEVRLLDWAALPLERLEQSVAAALRGRGGNSCLVGITAMSATYQTALKVARAFKRVDPEVIVCLGGHHATPEAEIILQRHRDIDVIVRGEGERPLLDLVRGIPMKGVAGISYRTPFGLIAATADPPPLSTEELDSIATDFDRLTSDAGKFGRVTIVTARGCPLGCRFCVVGRQQVRAKSIAAVISDIRRFVERGYRRFTVEDNFFAQSPGRTLALCGELAELQRATGGFVFDCQTRVESCSEPIVAALAEAGCDAVYLGVEALTPRQLSFLGKTSLPERFLDTLIQKTLPALFNRGIEVGVNLQVGLPETTHEERQETLIRLEEIGRITRQHSGMLRIFAHCHLVYPGTPEFRDGVAAMAFQRDIFESFTQWEADQGAMLHWLGTHFAHGAGGLPIALLDPCRLSRNEFELLEEHVQEADDMLANVKSIGGIELFDYSPELTSVEAI